MINIVRTTITSILLIILAYIISILLWQFFAKEDKTFLPDNNVKIVTTNNIPQNIFGVEKKIVKKKSYKKVKKTKLDIKLIGIIKKQLNPVAIIKLSSGLNKVYKIGEKINDLAEIKIIKNNFIIINYNGKDEKLVIERKTNEKLKKKIDKAIKNNNSQTLDYQKEKQINLSRKNKIKIRSYLQKAKVNPAKLLDIIKVEPNFVSGLLSGFKLFPAKEVALFKEIGFKSGDLVLEINNIKLDSFANAFSIGKKLAKRTNFNFVILRNNMREYINFNLD